MVAEDRRGARAGIGFDVVERFDCASSSAVLFDEVGEFDSSQAALSGGSFLRQGPWFESGRGRQQRPCLVHTAGRRLSADFG